MVLEVTNRFKVDKLYSQYGHTLKDMYGIKIITENRAMIMNVRDHILKRKDLQCVEEKNYLGKYRKKSGFEAYKIVVFFEEQYFEIQIQTEHMYEREQLDAKTSHTTYKEKQRLLRQHFGKEYHSFYEKLVRLFTAPNPDRCDNEPILFGP
jgi:ppGpp synthetase/RelA/SpoT-type nucleotidyltranferase